MVQRKDRETGRQKMESAGDQPWSSRVEKISWNGLLSPTSRYIRPCPHLYSGIFGPSLEVGFSSSPFPDPPAKTTHKARILGGKDSVVSCTESCQVIEMESGDTVFGGMPDWALS